MAACASQGFGLTNLQDVLYLDGKSSRAFYVNGQWSSGCSTCPIFTATGQSRIWTFVVTASTPMKITLTWQDYASTSISSDALINNLDLRVTQNNVRYYPNGLIRDDTKNNVEQVNVSSPVVGATVRVEVVATSLSFSQPYAIVATGAFEKTSALYPGAVPSITSITRAGTYVLQLIGANLPRRGFNGSAVANCTSNTTVPISASIVSASDTGTAVTLAISTVACTNFTLYLVSSGFKGDPVSVNLVSLSQSVRGPSG